MASSTNNDSSPKKKTSMRAVVWEGKPFEMAVRDVPLPKLE